MHNNRELLLTSMFLKIFHQNTKSNIYVDVNYSFLLKGTSKRTSGMLKTELTLLTLIPEWCSMNTMTSNFIYMQNSLKAIYDKSQYSHEVMTNLFRSQQHGKMKRGIFENITVDLFYARSSIQGWLLQCSAKYI